MRIKTDYVPEVNKHMIIPGKEYSVTRYRNGSNLVHVIYEDGEEHTAVLPGCAWLAGHPWTVVLDDTSRTNIKKPWWKFWQYVNS